MRIVVCVALRADSTPTALPAHDAHAVEAALRLAEGAGRADEAPIEIVVGVLAPAEALGVARGALAMGLPRGALVVAPADLDDDVIGRAHTMAAWVREQGPDLVLACPWSGDIDGTLFVTALAELVGLPVLTGARRLDLADGVVEIDRQTEQGDETVRTALPCVVEVGETLNQARYPTVKGRARAQNLPIELVRPADERAPLVTVGASSPRPADRTTRVVDDPAGAVAAIVELLRERGVA